MNSKSAFVQTRTPWATPQYVSRLSFEFLPIDSWVNSAGGEVSSFTLFYIFFFILIPFCSFFLSFSFWFIIDAPSNHCLFRSSKWLPWPLVEDSFEQSTKDSLFARFLGVKLHMPVWKLPLHLVQEAALPLQVPVGKTSSQPLPLLCPPCHSHVPCYTCTQSLSLLIPPVLLPMFSIVARFHRAAVRKLFEPHYPKIDKSF